MLKKFNKLLLSLIAESANDNEAKAKDLVGQFTTNDFYYRYVQPTAKECKVIATKQRGNCFLIYGKLKDVEKFFTSFKVDEDFIEKPSEFKIFSPVFSYGENVHNLKLDEDYPDYFTKQDNTTTHEIDNIARQTVHGRWYPLIDDAIANKIKAVKPSEITKYFKQLYPKADKAFNEETEIYIEFRVNCDQRANQIYDEMTEYASTPDEMNKLHNSDPDDFDYTQLNVKNVNDESTVKAALKNVKRTRKDYTGKSIK